MLEKYREELYKIIPQYIHAPTPWGIEMEKLLDQIIEAVEPAIEETREEGFLDGVKKTTDACDSTYGSMLKEAKKEEMERIVKAVESFPNKPIRTIIAMIECVDSALKEGE